MTDEAFWSRVDKTDTCWLWTGTTTDGYGIVRRRKIKPKGWLYAHRYSWMLTHGPIPPGALVLHTCDVRNCVRPDHLWLGSNADNLADMCQKDRSTRKLTSAQVREVRERWAAGERQVDLAAEFGIAQTTISRTIRFESGRSIR